MNKTNNFVKKQLLLVGLLLMCVTASAYNLPYELLVEDDYGHESSTYPNNGEPLLIEPLTLYQGSHRVVIMHERTGLFNTGSTSYGYYSLTIGGSEVNKGHNCHPLQNDVMYMCESSTIPKISIYTPGNNGTLGSLLDTYTPKLGYNKLSECCYYNTYKNKYLADEGDNGNKVGKIIVLPLLEDASFEFYKNTNFTSINEITYITEGEKAYFSAKGEGSNYGVKAFISTRYGLIPLETTNTGSKTNDGSYIYSFSAQRSSYNVGSKENQTICIFSYITSNGKRYYSSNYQEIDLTVYRKPSWSIVGAKEYSSTLYVLDGTASIKLKNTSGNKIRVRYNFDGSGKYNNQNNLDPDKEITIENINIKGKLQILAQTVVGSNTTGRTETTYNFGLVKHVDFSDVKVEYSCNNNTATVTIDNKYSDWKYPYSGYKLLIKKDDGEQKEYLQSDIVFPNLAPNTKLELTRKYDWNSNTDTKTIIIEDYSKSKYNLNSTTSENRVGCKDTDGSVGKITVNVNGGSGSYYYYINGELKATKSEKTYEFKPTIAGNYTIKVTDSNNCSTEEKTVNVKIDSPFDFTIVPKKTNGYDIACNGGKGTLTFSIKGGTGGYTYNGDPISNGASLSRSGVGPHSFTISDSRGCSETHSITLTQPAELKITKLDSIRADCKEANNGKVEVTASGGVGTLMYHLSNNSDGTIDRNDGIFTGLGVKSYTLSVTDANNCASPETTVTVGSNLKLEIAKIEPAECYDERLGSITLAPKFKDGFSFNYWLNGEEVNGPKIVNVEAGDNYKVKVKPVGSDCFAELGGIQVGGPTEPLQIETIDITRCSKTDSNDGELSVTPQGGTGEYKVSIKDKEGNDVKDSKKLYPGDYYVTITDANECVYSKKDPISIPSPTKDLGFIDTIIQHVTCNGGDTAKITVYADGGWPYPNGGYKYTLINSNNKKLYDNVLSNKSYTFSKLTAGHYKVIVTDEMKVADTISVEVKEPDPLSASSEVTKEISCPGRNDGKVTVTVSGGTAGYTLSFDNEPYTTNKTKEIDGISAGTHQYKVIDANKCEYSSTVEVDEPTAIELKANAAGELYNGYNISCNGEKTGIIVVSATGGTSGYQFSIDDGPFTAQYGENAQHTFSGIGAGEHNITAKDGHGCPASLPAKVKLKQPDPIVIKEKTKTQPLCYDSINGEITVIVSGGISTQDYNYSLNGVYDGSEGGEHTFENIGAKADHKVLVTDANGCKAETSIKLGQPAELTASVSNVKNNLCNGDKEGSITFTISGGTGSYYYALNGAAKTVAFGNDKTISGLPAKNAHSIVVSDAHECKADAIEQKITEPDKIVARAILNDYNGKNIRCNGGVDTAVINIEGGAGDNFSTTLGGITKNGKSVEFDNLKAGEYGYKVVNVNGGKSCVKEFSFEMKQADAVAFSGFASTDAKCHGVSNGELQVNVTGGVKSYACEITDLAGNSVNTATSSSGIYLYDRLAVGSYEFKVTDANGCAVSKGFPIKQPAPLTVSIANPKNVDCKGANTGEVSAVATGGSGSYKYKWSNGMTGQSIQNLLAGEYSVMVTDANNCQSEVDENGVKAQTTIDEPASALTMLEPVYANPTCSYNKDGEITINVSGGWGGYEYTLNGVSYGSNKIEGLDEGTYTAKVKDAGGCEVSTNDITLKKPEALSFENKIGTIICKGGATDVTITSASGGTGCNYSYSIDGGNTWQTGTTFANVVSGSYILRMKDGNECLATDKEITVTEPESLVLKEDVRHNYNGSTHKANGKITVTPQGGVMPYSYQWKDTTVTSQELDNIGFGIYTIIVTDSLGCVKTGTYYINDNNPTPEVVDAICPEGTEGSIRFGDTVKCTKVEWYNARTEELLPQSGTKTITGLPKGIYKAKLFNDTQVTYIYAEVKAPDSLKYATSQRNIDCHGDNTGMASVSFTGGVVPVSVVWKNQSDDEISHSQTIENLIKGKYTAYISDAKNCQSSSQALEFDITEPAEAFVLAESAHNDVKCHGNNDAVVGLSVSGNQGAVTYFQDEAAIPSNTANSLYAGAYTFYAVDEKNCQTQPLNVTVSQPDPLSSSVKTIMPIKCAAETGSVEVEAEGGTAPYSYKVLEQTEFRLSPVFDGLTTADYKFVVKDNNNCHDTASYLLTEPEQLVITGSKLKDEYCGHSDGTISVDVEGGTGGYDIRWSDYQTGEMASGLPAGSYMVSVYDENRCLATETYDIKDIPAPVISIKSIDSTKCYGSADGVAELNVSLGTGAIAYHWETETTGVPYSGKLKAGQQSVVAVDEIGCADTAQFTMPQPDSMKIEIAVANPLCFNDNSGELTATVSNYKMGLSYKWDNGVAGSENRGLYAGTYGVSVTNANGCVAKKSATLVYPAKITIKKLAIADTKCDQPNGSVTVTATGGTGVLKYGVNMGAVAAANKIEGLLSGNHKLTVVDDNQCSIDTTVHVGANVPPVLVINTRDDVKCHGESNGKVSVGVEGGRTPFSYSWDSGDRTTMSAKNGLGVGSHKVYVFDGFGCSDTLDFAIEEPYVLEIYESGSTDPVCYGYSNGQIVAGVMGGTAPYTYQWGDRQSTAKATGLAAGTHYVNVTDKNGCKAKRYFTLSNPQPVVVDIPEVISICSNQTADIDAGHEGSFHYWSSANGFESVAQNISVSKKGTYVVTVTTPDGCIGRDSTYVNVSEKEINSNFLLQSDAYVGDTIVMIEISWPIPESIEWSCPEGMTVISDSGDEIEMVATKEGVYDVGLTTYNDICTEQTFKSIVVNPVAQKPAPRKLMAQKIIKEVKVYPNPAAGPFNLEIELSEEHDVTIEIVHMSGTLQKKRHMKGDRRYVLNFSNADLNAGINTITVIAGDEIVTKKLVIIR